MSSAALGVGFIAHTAVDAYSEVEYAGSGLLSQCVCWEYNPRWGMSCGWDCGTNGSGEGEKGAAVDGGWRGGERAGEGAAATQGWRFVLHCGLSLCVASERPGEA